MSITDHADLFPDNQLSEYAVSSSSNLRVFYLLNLPRLIHSLQDKSCKLFVHMNVADTKVKPQMVIQYVLGPQAGAMAIVRLCVPADCFDIELQEEEPYVSPTMATFADDYEIIPGSERNVLPTSIKKQSYCVSLKRDLGSLTTKGEIYLQYLQQFKSLVQQAINEQCQRMESPPYPLLVALNDDYVATGQFKVSRELLPYTKDPQKKLLDDAAHIAKFEATKKIVEDSEGGRVFTCSLQYMISSDTDKGKRKIYPWFQMIHGAVYKVKEPVKARPSKKKSAKKPVVTKSEKLSKRSRDEEEEDAEEDAVPKKHGIDLMSDDDSA